MTLSSEVSIENQKISITIRLLSKAIDFSIFIFIAFILPQVVGSLFGLIYFLISDGIFKGQSPGKKIFKLIVLQSESKLPCTVRESVFRNSTLGIAAFFAIIPLWGWILLVLIGIPMVILEIYLMKSRPDGTRLGDVIADTIVNKLSLPK